MVPMHSKIEIGLPMNLEHFVPTIDVASLLTPTPLLVRGEGTALVYPHEFPMSPGGGASIGSWVQCANFFGEISPHCGARETQWAVAIISSAIGLAPTACKIRLQYGQNRSVNTPLPLRRADSE